MVESSPRTSSSARTRSSRLGRSRVASCGCIYLSAEKVLTFNDDIIYYESNISPNTVRSHHKTTPLFLSVSLHTHHTKNTNDRRTNERVLRGCHRRMGRRCQFHRLRATGGYDFDEGTKRVDSIVRAAAAANTTTSTSSSSLERGGSSSRCGNEHSKRAPICLSRRWVQSVLSRSPGGDDGHSVAKYDALCRVRRRRAMEQNIDGKEQREQKREQ